MCASLCVFLCAVRIRVQPRMRGLVVSVLDALSNSAAEIERHVDAWGSVYVSGRASVYACMCEGFALEISSCAGASSHILPGGANSHRRASPAASNIANCGVRSELTP